jgi:hypothetical protein
MSCTQKLSITSHEYLRALGLEESDYRYSNSFLNNNFTNDKILNEELVKMVESFCSQDSKLQNRNASFSKHNKNDEYTFKKRDYFTCLDSLKKEIDQDGYIYVDPNLISSSISPNSYTDLKVYEIKYGLLSIGGWHSNVYIGDMALRANILLNAKVEEAKKRHVLLGIKYNSIIQDQGFTFSNSVANLFKVSDMQISNGLQEQTLAIRWQHYLSKAAWALNTDSVATRSQGRSVIKSFDPKGGNLDLALEDQDLSKKLVEVIIAIEQHIQCSIK